MPESPPEAREPREPAPAAPADAGGRRLRAVLAATGQALLVAEPHGRVVEATGWEALVGRPAAEALGEGWLAAVHVADREAAARAWRRAFEAGVELRVGFRLAEVPHPGNGAAGAEARWVEASGVPVLAADRHVREWVVALRPAVPPAAWAERLKASEAELAEVQALAGVGSWTWDLAADRSGWSAEMFRILGYPPAMEVKAVSGHFERIHPEDRPMVEAAVQAALAGPAPYDVYYRVFRPDGVLRAVHVRGVVARDASGRALRMTGTLQDVTDLRATEQALRDAHARVEGEVARQTEALRAANARQRESEHRLQEAQRVARIGSWDWDVVADAVTWSDEMYRLSGLPIGTPLNYEAIARCIHPDDRARHDRLVAMGIERHEPWVFDYRAVHPDGTVIVLEARGHALYGDDGLPLRCHGTSQDVTARRAIEAENAARSEALERANRELTKVDAMKDQFLSVLSHELRTPINAVTGFASVLADEVAGPLNPEQRRFAERILASSDLLLALIDDLLDVSRISAGKLSLAIEPIALRQVVADALATLAPLIERSGHRVVDAIPADLPAVMADGQRVGQMLVNLITNALKYTPAGCTVTLAAATAPGRVRVEVRDDGPGIAKADQAKLFKRFSQLDEGNARSAKGAGLGLSIVKALAEAHGGEAGVESEVDVGSTFWFTLPLAGA